MYETEPRHYLREVLMAAIHRADEGCADWRIADALLDAGEITWNYQIRPEPQVATFQLIFTATDAEPASGGVVEPSPLTAEEATPDCTCARAETGLPGRGKSVLGRLDPACPVHAAKPIRRQHDPGALIEEPDLYEQGGHLDGEFADERGKFDPLIGEQGEGGVR